MRYFRLLDIIDTALIVLNEKKSKGEIKRLIISGAVRINGKKHFEPMELYSLQYDDVIQIGKRLFVRNTKMGDGNGKG